MYESINHVQILVAIDDNRTEDFDDLMFAEGRGEITYCCFNNAIQELSRGVCPDIIILDWRRLDSNCPGLVNGLKTEESLRSIPILVVAGANITDEYFTKALIEEVDNLIRRPFTSMEFQIGLKSMIEIQRRNLMIRQLEEAVERKTRELACMSTLELQKSVLLNDLLDQVGRLDRITNFVYATNIKDIQKQLRKQLNLERSWECFKIYFEEIHSDFFERLDRTFDRLSLNERKLCAYIKMGLGNFELSQMAGTSDAAIRKAINRLKKKLALKARDDIRKFFFEF